MRKMSRNWHVLNVNGNNVVRKTNVSANPVSSTFPTLPPLTSHTSKNVVEQQKANRSNPPLLTDSAKKSSKKRQRIQNSEDTVDSPAPAPKKPRGRGRPPSTNHSDPLDPKRRKQLTKIFDAVYDAVIDVTDEDGRDRSELFMELPDRREYRDYYAIIKRPISLEMIRKRISGNLYTSLQGFKEDFRTIWQNARTYNEEGSLVVEDANALEVLTYFDYVNRRPSSIASWMRLQMDKPLLGELLLILLLIHQFRQMCRIRPNRWHAQVSKSSLNNPLDLWCQVIVRVMKMIRRTFLIEFLELLRKGFERFSSFE